MRFRFKLSKIGAGRHRRALGGKTYLSTSASFSHGERYIRWVPPHAKRERTYTYTLHARDLAGNSASAEGEVRVRAALRRSRAGPKIRARGVESAAR